MSGAAWRSALLYAAITFGAAFVLAVARDLVQPWTGRGAAVVGWGAAVIVGAVLAARWVLPRRHPRAGLGTRLGIGAVAAAVIIALEALLSLLLRGQSPARFVAQFATFEGGVLLVMYAMVLLAPCVAGRTR